VTDAETVTLPVQCHFCEQAVNLMYQPVDAHKTILWLCPYAECRKPQPVDLRGTLVRVVPTYEPKM
jgi:hypothetical protein